MIGYFHGMFIKKALVSEREEQLKYKKQLMPDAMKHFRTYLVHIKN